MADEGAGATRKIASRTGWARYQYPVNILLIGNALAAAYWLLTREDRPKRPDEEGKMAADVTTKTIEITPAIKASPIIPKVQVSNNDQVEIYKWMLAEKRKLKPSTSVDKARIDAEKAILKDYIRSKIPLL